MNILEAEDIIKGLPDQALFEEAQMPSGQVPQFLVVSEIQRRSDMRKRFQEQQPNQGTVKDQIVQQGIMGAMPPQMATPMPTGMPTGMPNQMPTGMPAQGMFDGGIIRLQEGGFLDREITRSRPGPYNRSTVRESIEEALSRGASMADLLAIFKNQPEAIDLVKELTRDRQRASVSQYNPLFDEGVSDLDRAFIASDRAKDIVADQIGSRFNYFQPPEIVGDVVEGAVNAYRSIPSMEDLVSSARGALPAPPSRESVASAGRQAGEGLVGLMRGMLPEAPERGQTPDLAGRYAEQLASMSLPDLGDPTREEALAADRRRVASIREGITPLSEEISPFGTYGSTPEEFAAKRGQYSLPEGAGSNFPETFQSGRDVNTQLASLPAMIRKGFEEDEELVERNRNIREGVGSFFDTIFGVPERPDYEIAGLDPAQSDAPGLSEAIATVQQLTSDASKKRDGVGLLYEDDGVLEMLSGTGSKEVQGTSGRQVQGTPDKTEPSLDFADLLADMKKQTMAQSLVQLGAGIAGGDLSKGISAAGMAAMKGNQAEKALAIRERLAEYQAGREDIARAEKGRQFNKQMEILESRYKNELAKAASVGRNELFRTVTSLVETAMEGSSEFDPAKREAMVQAMMKKYLTAYAPAFDVDPETVSFGVQEDQRAGQPQSEWGVVGR